MIKRSIFFLTIVLFASCGKNKMSSDILKPDKMQAVFWDILRADAFTEDFQKKDSTKNANEENVKLQKQVFLIHNTSREQFYKSYDYYKQQPDLMKTLLDSIINKANRERSQIQLRKPLKKITDTVTTTVK